MPGSLERRVERLERALPAKEDWLEWEQARWVERFLEACPEAAEAALGWLHDHDEAAKDTLDQLMLTYCEATGDWPAG